MILPGSLIASRAGVIVPNVDPSLVAFRPMPGWMLPLVGGRADAMTLYRTVLIHPTIWDDVEAGRRPELIAHELVHVRQWADEGPLRFLAQYLGDYVRFRSLGCRHHDAYRHIRYEWAAYSEARNIVQRP